MTQVSANNRGNPFLSQVMRALRKKRPFLEAWLLQPSHREEITDGDYAQLWFPTNGCSWDGCTMCDYGKGTGVSSDNMVAAVRQGLEAINFEGLKYLQVSPSGSNFDEAEVPLEAQHQIYDLMRQSPAETLLFETRAETITHETLARVREHIGEGRPIHIIMGLESSSSAIQRYCINKGSLPSLFESASAIVHAHEMKVFANISLGTAFLSPTEALEDAYRSTLWALEHGADMAILYPMIVKPHTLLDLLYQDNRYRAPSLWALVEVLRRVGPELISRVGISWYKNYSGLPVTEQPTTCELCEADILKRLDDYYATQSWDIVQELSEWPCSCRESWQQSLQESHQETTMPLSERVIESYDYLAEELSLQRYWAKRRDDFLEELLSEVLKSTG